MFCKNCGAEIAEDDFVCTECGTPAYEKVIDDAQDISSEEKEEPVLELNTDGEKESVPKKRKLSLWISLGVLAVAVVLLILNFSSLKVWYSRTFNTPHELMAEVYQDSLKDGAQLYSGTNTLMNITKSLDRNDNYDLDVDFHIGDELIGLIETSVGDGIDLSWISDFSVTREYSTHEHIIYDATKYSLNDHTVYTQEVYYDNENELIYSRMPDFSDTAIRSEWYSAAETTEYTDILKNAMPEDEIVYSFLQRHFATVLSGFGKVESSDEMVAVGDLTEELLVLKATMTAEEMASMMNTLLNDLKSDQDLKNYLDTVSAAYNENQNAQMEQIKDEFGIEYEPSSEDFYINFVDSVNEILEDIKKTLPELSEEDYLILYTYLDSDNTICGIRMDAFGDVDIPGLQFSYITITQKADFCAEMVLASGLRIEGSGALDKSSKASFQVYDNDVHVMQIDIVDCEIKDGQMTCTIQLKPGKKMIDAMSEDMDPAVATVLFLSDPTLEVRCNADLSELNIEFALLAGTKELLLVDMVYNKTDGSEIVLPENIVDSKDILALSKYYESLNMDAVYDNLLDAGVPQELMDSLSNMIG